MLRVSFTFSHKLPNKAKNPHEKYYKVYVFWNQTSLGFHILWSQLCVWFWCLHNNNAKRSSQFHRKVASTFSFFTRFQKLLWINVVNMPIEKNGSQFFLFFSSFSRYKQLKPENMEKPLMFEKGAIFSRFKCIYLEN